MCDARRWHRDEKRRRMTDAAENRDVVRAALEQVCARGDMALAPSCYAEDFVDHVGRLEYRGLESVRRSTALYRALLDDLAFEAVDQVAEGDRVATRFLVTGSNRGRRVRLEAITLSRLRDGRIVEDWSGFDSFELLRQLGLRRSLAAAPRMLRAFRDGRAS
jgi:predicted ester cyclase